MSFDIVRPKAAGFFSFAKQTAQRCALLHCIWLAAHQEAGAAMQRCLALLERSEPNAMLCLHLRGITRRTPLLMDAETARLRGCPRLFVGSLLCSFAYTAKQGVNEVNPKDAAKELGSVLAANTSDSYERAEVVHETGATAEAPAYYSPSEAPQAENPPTFEEVSKRTRGPITGLSKKSSKRLQLVIRNAHNKWEDFVTLTYAWAARRLPRQRRGMQSARESSSYYPAAKIPTD
ncbi:unnamed protein product [Sphagnum tenellum]